MILSPESPKSGGFVSKPVMSMLVISSQVVPVYSKTSILESGEVLPHVTLGQSIERSLQKLAFVEVIVAPTCTQAIVEHW